MNGINTINNPRLPRKCPQALVWCEETKGYHSLKLSRRGKLEKVFNLMKNKWSKIDPMPITFELENYEIISYHLQLTLDNSLLFKLGLLIY
jgi:hypothetical protein